MENKKYKNDKDILAAALTAFSLNALDFLDYGEWVELNKRTDYISERLENTYDENGNVKDCCDKIRELEIERLRIENTDKESVIGMLTKEIEDLKQKNECTATLLDEARKDVAKLAADVKYYRDKCNGLIHANGALLDACVCCKHRNRLELFEL